MMILLNFQMNEVKNYHLLFRSLLPIVLPIVLIFLNTTLYCIGAYRWIGYDYIIFLGQPIIAVGLALIAAIYALAGHMKREDSSCTNGRRHELLQGLFYL